MHPRQDYETDLRNHSSQHGQHAQDKGALEGIALADYEMISRHAATIRNLMLDESWMVVQSQDYRRQSNEFRTIIEQLQQAAKDKNVDRATLAYVQMTIRCVQCHQSLRK